MQSKFVPLVQQEENSSQDFLLALCQGVLDMIKAKPKGISTVLDAALDELHSVAIFLLL